MGKADDPSDKGSVVSGQCLKSCEELASIFRALGHPARLAIIKQLASQDEACCGEIVSHLPLAQSTVSQHLQVLKDADLLICDARGRNCHYLLNWSKLSQAEHCSAQFWDSIKSMRPDECETGGPAIQIAGE
ncbi:MAG: helix-turn-helix transcriptional regulator [Roseibium sp.]|nr:helix-turn-helix transcriptional regulator [Roseibium sp.]